jgi:prevent-host-death family protein
MADVTVGELRNHPEELVDRAMAGERIMVLRSGIPVAQLVAARRAPLSLSELRERRRTLPAVDPVRFRADIEEVVDSAL